MRFLKSGAKRFLILLWKLIPGPLRAMLLRQALAAEADGSPADALRRLFRLNDELDQLIINASTDYGAGANPKHRLMNYNQFFVHRSKDAARILDVGCGRGIVISQMVKSLDRAEIVGIDSDEGCIQYARQHFAHPRLRFLVGKAPGDLAGESFDVVILSNILEHVEHRREFLEVLIRRAAPRRILVRLPLYDRDWVIPLRQELGLPYFSDSTHFAELTAAEWMREIESAGLSITHHEIRWGEIWLEAAPLHSPPPGS